MAEASYFSTACVYTQDSFRIEDQLVGGEKVVTRMTGNVRIRETGEPVTFLGINIARIVDGKSSKNGIRGRNLRSRKAR